MTAPPIVPLNAPLIDSNGWYQPCQHLPSPNFAARPEGVAPTLLVIHAISLPPFEFGGGDIAALFCNQLEITAHPYFAGLANLRVSAHFVIERSGAVLQFVSCNDAAWHAGVSAWRGQAGCNAFSIGIELEGCDDLAFTDAQYASLQPLVLAIMQKYPNLQHAAGHCDIAPGRKTDPGLHFDWAQLPKALTQWRENPDFAPQVVPESAISRLQIAKKS